MITREFVRRKFIAELERWDAAPPERVAAILAGEEDDYVAARVAQMDQVGAAASWDLRFYNASAGEGPGDAR